MCCIEGLGDKVGGNNQKKCPPSNWNGSRHYRRQRTHWKSDYPCKIVLWDMLDILHRRKISSFAAQIYWPFFFLSFSFLLWVVYMGDDEFVNIQNFPSSSCILGPIFCAIKGVRAQWNDWVGQPKSVVWEQLSNLLGRSNKWADKKCQTTNIQTFSDHYVIIIIPCCTLQTLSPPTGWTYQKKGVLKGNVGH